MANRPFKHLSKKYLEKLKEISLQKVDNNDTFRKSFKLMLETLQQDNPDGITGEDIMKIHQNPVSDTWQSMAIKLMSQHGTVFSRYNKLYNEEKSILRVEAKAHRQAVFYRFLTTLAIGFGVMLIYFLADSWGIRLPLIRF